MVLKTILCLGALVALSNAASCPTFTCDSGLQVNTCASYTGASAFKLNSIGCQIGYQCSALEVHEWAMLLYMATTSPTTTHPCSVIPTSTTVTSLAPVNCGTKIVNKNFKNSKTIVSCNANTDCVLVDNSYTTCMCVFKNDGSGICKVDKNNDDIYGGYWDDCGSSEVITDEDTAVYWAFYMSYWEYMQSSLSCMNIFMEESKLSSLKLAYDGAATLAMGVVGLVALY